MRLEINSACELSTRLPGAATSLTACRASDDACASAAVAVEGRTVGAAELAEVVDALSGLPPGELARQATLYAPALNELPPGARRRRLKGQVMEMIEDSLVGQDARTTLAVQRMNRTAVPAGCDTTQMPTAVHVRFQTTNYGAGSAGSIRSEVAAALVLDDSYVTVCPVTTVSAGVAAAPRRRALQQVATPTPSRTAAATGTATAYDANPFSPTPTPAAGSGTTEDAESGMTEVAVYIADVDLNQEEAVVRQLQALFTTSELPELRAITPGLRQTSHLPVFAQAAAALLANTTDLTEMHALQNKVALKVCR